MIAGVQMLSRKRTPQIVFASIEEGVEWMLTRPGVESSLTPETLTPAIHALADRYGST